MTYPVVPKTNADLSPNLFAIILPHKQVKVIKANKIALPALRNKLVIELSVGNVLYLCMLYTCVYQRNVAYMTRYGVT